MPRTPQAREQTITRSSCADRFYAACGYKEVGRVPGAIRVADGDDRDDVVMLLPLL